MNNVDNPDRRNFLRNAAIAAGGALAAAASPEFRVNAQGNENQPVLNEITLTLEYLRQHHSPLTVVPVPGTFSDFFGNLAAAGGGRDWSVGSAPVSYRDEYDTSGMAELIHFQAGQSAAIRFLFNQDSQYVLQRYESSPYEVSDKIHEKVKVSAHSFLFETLSGAWVYSYDAKIFQAANTQPQEIKWQNPVNNWAEETAKVSFGAMGTIKLGELLVAKNEELKRYGEQVKASWNVPDDEHVLVFTYSDPNGVMHPFAEALAHVEFLPRPTAPKSPNQG